MCGVRAKDNCEAVSPNDLSFVIGELMDIIKNPTDQPKWVARKVCKNPTDQPKWVAGGGGRGLMTTFGDLGNYVNGSTCSPQEI